MDDIHKKIDAIESIEDARALKDEMLKDVKEFLGSEKPLIDKCLLSSYALAHHQLLIDRIIEISKTKESEDHEL